MKPNKSPGCDKILAEPIKYAPETIKKSQNTKKSQIYNTMTEAGYTPKKKNI